MPEVPVLVESLVDDAALFPPGNAPMRQALRQHVLRWETPADLITGRFLAPASRLDELRRELSALAAEDGRVQELLTSRSVALGVVLDTDIADLPRIQTVVADDAHVLLALVEVAVTADTPAALVDNVATTVAALPDAEGYVELPRRPGWREALEVVADSPYGAKLRTGGLRADLFPTEAEAAEFVATCVAAEVPFKCTAGLHSAVRHRDPETGFEHHGFLNLLCATAAATEGADLESVVRLLGVQDDAALAAVAAELDDVRAAVTRSFFVAYGSCDLQEPWQDLTRLGLL